ncbi:MAG: glycosyltransferase family 4 protein [Candidatus Hermodarchaeota archaeon]
MNNILYLPTRYFPAISGAEFYFQRMAEILTSVYNYSIEVFTSNAVDFKALRDPHGRKIQPENKFFNLVNSLKIQRFPVNYDIGEKEILQKLKKIESFNTLNLNDDCVKKLIKNGPYLEELIEKLISEKNQNFDLVHTTFFPYFNLIISLLIGKLMNIPTVCTPFFHFSNPRYSDLILNEILMKFDFLIACTHLEKEALIEKCKIQEDKIIVIPMGVDYHKFKRTNENKLETNYFKENFLHKKEKKYKIVLFCGYKNYEKGAISILKSIPFILEKLKNIYFVFIGPATKAYNRELSKIQKHKNSRIINFSPDNLTGYYDRKKLAAFKEADIYLMPSRSDAFGIAFLEAWAAGIPVIGAKIGATPEVIRDNVDGLLVEFDNPLDIAQNVIKLIKHKKFRKKLGLAGQIRVSQNYTWDIIAEKTHKAYQNIIHKCS